MCVMNKAIPLAFLFLAFGFLQAQHVSKNKIGYQTNFLSFLRTHPAVNLGVVIVNTNDKLVDFGVDVGFALLNSNDVIQTNYPLNYHNSLMGPFPSLDFQLGITHFFNDRSGFYYGYRGSAGWFAFNHNYSLCTESRFNGSVCVCENLERITTATQTLRLGAAIRLGHLTPVTDNHYFDLAFDIGLFYHYRLRDLEVAEHSRCGLDGPRDPFNGYSPDGIVTFGLLDFNSVVYPYFRFILAYRFM
jgi:hypothetical protein